MSRFSARQSLWAMPATSDGAPFAEWIERLAVVAGSVTFAPHITLVGSVPATVNEEAIGREVRGTVAFKVDLVGLADSAERHRCITAVAVPDPPLLALRAVVLRVWGGEPTPYEPHLSLLYAEMVNAERRRLRNSIDLAFPVTIRVDAVSLVDTTGDDEALWETKRMWPLRYGP